VRRVSEGYYRDPRFCLECAYTHARDVEHHLEDWGKFATDRTQRIVADELRDKQRSIRKEIDKWRMKLSYGSDYEAQAKEAANPEIPEKCRFEKEEVKPKEYFDPASFRTLCPECPQARCRLCPEELACATRIIIGCKKGEFIRGRCQIGTETHVIYHGYPK